MPTPKLIALCGAKRSGKDTLAAHLVVKHGYIRKALADPIKHVVGYMFGFSHEQMETDAKEEQDPRWGISPRQALQFFGTEMMQYKIQELLPGIGRMFWTRSLIASLDPVQKYAISDVRFVHEYNALREQGALVIKVVRPTLQNSDTHASEQEYKDIQADITLINDSTIEDLLIKLDNALAIE